MFLDSTVAAYAAPRVDRTCSTEVHDMRYMLR